MALAKEIMGTSLISSSKAFNYQFHKKQSSIRVSPSPVFAQQERINLQLNNKVVKEPIVAAISEDNLIRVAPEKEVKFKVRAVVIVRNKNKGDLKESFLKHLDAFTDKIGRNVVLELISSEIDPKTKSGKKSNQAVLKDWSKKSNLKTEKVNYIAEFLVNQQQSQS